ncbi:RNA polymerase sigma factor [Sphingobacterium sp. SRCM116780]|uniref:RNA polymerase sigma factor n=1 Tax=Sphingobacterium sp. SRCM116780 TaxID=2907623 RepID=UPI001F3C4D53|nr:RNA polymerase sigma factor [Sphingobacterium sp. SRCM116780]UIR54630.1 RNA polymerase sigma factor [Sphingobacterium sp. SRCM116780]
MEKNMRFKNEEEIVNYIYSEKYRNLTTLARKFTTDSDEINDLIQETITRSLKYIGRFLDSPKLMAWLYTIMRNIFINDYRRNQRHQHLDNELSNNVNIEKTANNMSENKFIREDIQKAVEKINKDYSEAFFLYFEGYKYYEIAEHLGIPEGTVKTRIHMARKQLQKQLVTYKEYAKN